MSVTLETLLTWEPGMYPPRVQRRRSAGWHAPTGPDVVFVGRCHVPSCTPGGCWGNPYRVGQAVTVDVGAVTVADAEHAVRLYWHDLTSATPRCEGLAARRARLGELRGKKLMCWCPLPEPGAPDWCHAAALTVLANPNPGVLDPAGLDPKVVNTVFEQRGWWPAGGFRGTRRWQWPGDTRTGPAPQVTVYPAPAGPEYDDEFNEAMQAMLASLTDAAIRGRQAARVLDELTENVLWEVPADVQP